MVHGLIGTHIATGQVVEIPLNIKETLLGVDVNPETMNISWDMLCDSVQHRTGITIQGEIEIDTFVTRGQHFPFH